MPSDEARDEQAARLAEIEAVAANIDAVDARIKDHKETLKALREERADLASRHLHLSRASEERHPLFDGEDEGDDEGDSDGSDTGSSPRLATA